MKRALVAVCFCVGCSAEPGQPRYEFVPEMVDSVAYESFAPNPITRDGKTLQLPPAGTLARAATPFHYQAGEAEAQRAGRERFNPLPPTPEAVARGEHVFQSICTPCHGRGGLGDGPIIPRFPTPPSLVAEHAKALPDGRIFHLISRGQGLMPSHAAQVAPEDRWRVVHYLRTLQKGGAR